MLLTHTMHLTPDTADTQCPPQVLRDTQQHRNNPNTNTPALNTQTEALQVAPCMLQGGDGAFRPPSGFTALMTSYSSHHQRPVRDRRVKNPSLFETANELSA